MRKRGATIRDVAVAAGVSPSTVSHALSGKRGISEPVKERILAAVRELDYRPSLYAQAMKGQTGLVGVVVDDTGNPSTSRYLEVLSAALTRESLCAVVGLAGRGRERGLELLRRFSSGLCDGVINLLPAVSPEEASACCGAVPVVTNIREPQMPIELDYERLTEELLSYLWGMGHRRIGYITSSARMSGEDTTIGVMVRFHVEHGVPFDACQVVEGDDSLACGMSGAERLRAEAGVTAIIAGNDQMAFGVYRWARERGLRVPEDISVIGYDDVPLASLASPALTTCRFPVEEVVAHTVRLLLGKLGRGELPSGTLRLRLSLVERDSVCRRRVEEP